MTVRSILSFLTASSCLLAAMGVTACGATVTSGTYDGVGADSSSSSSSSSSGSIVSPPCDDCVVPPALPAAIAVSAAQLGYNNCDDGPTTSSGTGGSGCSAVDPTTVYLELGTPSPSCATPQPSVACGGTFSVSIGIPAARLVVGEIQLGDPSLIATFSESGAADPENEAECPFGGGSFVNGTLTISAVDAASVTFTLTGTQGFDFAGGTADGTYVAARCP